MIKRVFRRFLSLALVLLMTLTLLPVMEIDASAATSGKLTGLSNSDIGASYTATDSGSNASWSASGNTITGNVISASGCNDTAYETTLTLINNKSATATLSFDYTIAQNSGTIQVAGNAVTANGSYSGELAPGGSIKVYLKSGSTSAATSISITNLSLISDVSATTTFLPGENGSYTVDGVEITAKTSKTQQSDVAYTLVATPASGYQFFGWYSVTGNNYLSSDATATLNFDNEQTIKPVFIDASLAIFETGGVRFYDLNEANNYAAAKGQDKIVLLSDGTLPSGAYTISSGITLVIPFDSINAYYTTSPSYTTTASTPKAYRTLTMASGASIDVQGSISVGAKHYTSSGTNNGNPTGAYGYIVMQDGSSITVKDGGALYAWGYISGSGHITAESGSSVYEYFQIADWRGGSAASSMKNAYQKVFPFSQYYVQNIEAPLTLMSGATENVYTSITAKGISASATIPFVGTGAMFELSDGSTFTKTYDPNTDRIVFDVDGDISLNSIALSVLTISVNSNAYVLPINNNVTLNIHSGTTTVNQDVALQPGVQVSIDSGAELKVASGCSLYVYDQNQWGTYCQGGQFKSVAYSPTKAKIRSNADLVDVVMDINGTLTADGYLYTTDSGADIKTSAGTGTVVLTNGAGTATTTYQATQSGSTITYVAIPITAAKLHNGSRYVSTEDEYTLTNGAAAGVTYVYNTNKDMWVKEGETENITITFDANGGKGSMDPQTVESGAYAVLNNNTFTREHYTFGAWNTQSDGNGVVYQNGATVKFTENTTLYAIWEPETYTVTWKNGETVLKTETLLYGATPKYEGETPTKAADVQYTYSFSGWVDSEGNELTANTTVTGNVTYTAVFSSTVNTYTVTFDANGGEGSMEAQSFNYGADVTLTENTLTRENYKFTGWNTKKDGTGTIYADEATINNLTEDITLYAQWRHNDGWFETESGKTYYQNGELQKTGWTTIGGQTYYLNTETGYAAMNGIYWLPYPEGYGPDQWDIENNTNYTALGYDKNSYFIFNAEGVFQNTVSGFYTVTADTKIVGGNAVAANTELTAWAVNGELPWHPGLVICNGAYYYFTTGYFENGNSYICGQDYSVSKPNDLAWPSEWGEGTFTVGKYTFDADGKLQLYDGFTDIGDETYYYVNGVKTYAGLIQIGDDYYYVNSSCKVIKGQSYTVSKTNGLLSAGTYDFDDDGKMIREDTTKNGIVKETEDTWYYYVNGVKTYAGLIEIDGDFYYVNSKFEVIHGRNYFISKTNGLMEQKTYYFDAEGKLVKPDAEKNGIVKESDDTWYYYVDGVKTYAGLIQIEGDYYYVNSSFKVIHNQNYYVSKTNGLKAQGTYEFNADGKMVIATDDAGGVKNGIVKETDDTWYYYVDGTKTYAGLIVIDGSYYYVNSKCEVIHGRQYFISKTNGLLANGTYTFDEDGKMNT